MKITRVVTLASKTGRYGGPFDTALNQSHLVACEDMSVELLAGYLANDCPQADPANRHLTQTMRRVFGYSTFAGPVPLFSPTLAASLIRAIRSSHVVHISFAREAIPVYATVVALLLKKKIVLQPHGMLTIGRGRAGFLDPIMRRLIARCDHIIALTNVEAEQIRDWAASVLPPISVIGNPLLYSTTAKPVASPENGLADEALFIGRLAPRKNVSHFIEAARLAHRKGRSQLYSIVGPDGGDLQLAEAAEDELPNLHYEGSVAGSEVSMRIARASVLALTSSREPWGNALVTAIALGVPVVVPQSAALASEIEHHGAGHVYPDGDAARLADDIHRLTTDPDARAKALLGCKSFTQENLLQATIHRRLAALYKSL